MAGKPGCVYVCAVLLEWSASIFKVLVRIVYDTRLCLEKKEVKRIRRARWLVQTGQGRAVALEVCLWLMPNFSCLTIFDIQTGCRARACGSLGQKK